MSAPSNLQDYDEAYVSTFPGVEDLLALSCWSWMELTWNTLLASLELFNLDFVMVIKECQTFDFVSLRIVPDFSYFSHLEELSVAGCESFMGMTCNVQLPALK